MAETIRVTGAARLETTLNRAARDVERMEEATARAAELVAEDAARRAPKRTGRLARSVVSRPRAGVAQVAATAPYGMFVEYGTSRNPPRPFMRPALASKTAAVTAIYLAEVKDILSTVKGA
jgi:HK97 gp10 family phage protein